MIPTGKPQPIGDPCVLAKRLLLEDIEAEAEWELAREDRRAKVEAAKARILAKRAARKEYWNIYNMCQWAGLGLGLSVGLLIGIIGGGLLQAFHNFWH